MGNLYLWLVSQDQYGGYDIYDSFVVASESHLKASLYDPNGRKWPDFPKEHSSWCDSPDFAKVQKIGMATPDLSEGDIVISSFNAG